MALSTGGGGKRTDSPAGHPETAAAANAPSGEAQPANVVVPAAASTVADVPATYQYNEQGQLQAIIYADGTAYRYRYNPAGDKISETGTKGQTWVYVYDQNHHPVTVINPQGQSSHPGDGPP